MYQQSSPANQTWRPSQVYLHGLKSHCLLLRQLCHCQFCLLFVRLLKLARRTASEPILSEQELEKQDLRFKCAVAQAYLEVGTELTPADCEGTVAEERSSLLSGRAVIGMLISPSVAELSYSMTAHSFVVSVVKCGREKAAADRFSKHSRSNRASLLTALACSADMLWFQRTIRDLNV